MEGIYLFIDSTKGRNRLYYNPTLSVLLISGIGSSKAYAPHLYKCYLAKLHNEHRNPRQMDKSMIQLSERLRKPDFKNVFLAVDESLRIGMFVCNHQGGQNAAQLLSA